MANVWKGMRLFSAFSKVAPSVLRNTVDDSVIQNVNKAITSNESRLFAVIHLNGKQYKVTTEDVLQVPSHMDPDIGEKIRLEKVLMVGGEKFTLLGRPIVSRNLVRVEATVLEKTLSHYHLRYFYERRNRLRRFKVRRYMLTTLLINDIEINPVS